MANNGYYPAGADYDPDAPWNEDLLVERSFEVEVTLTLVRRLTVVTDRYYREGGDGECVLEDPKGEARQAFTIPDGWEVYEMEAEQI